MGYRSDTFGDEKITLSHPAYWVKVKKCLTRTEQKKVEGALMSVTYNDKDGVNGTPEISQSRDLLVVLSVLDWNLTDDDDKAIPVNPGTILTELSGPDFELVWKRLNALNKTPSGPEAAAFPGTGERGDNAGGTGAGKSA